MRARWLSVVAAGCLSAVCSRAGEVTALPPPSGTGIERGVAVVRCATPTEGVVSSSRAAILDTGAPADVLLTAAHGLPEETSAVVRDCRVLVRGRAQPIVAVWRSRELENPEVDWAVILTKRIDGDVHRWRAARATAQWLETAVAEHAPVRLVLRYAGAAQSDCHLEPRTPDPRRLIAHSCVTYPGTSGSPLVAGVEPEPMLIGIHIGTQLQFDGRKLEFVSVARPIDAEVVAAIDAAIAAAAERAARRRAPR